MHVFQPLLPKKGMFFSHFCPKNTHFSATSAQKGHIFQPLLPKKARFSATSAQKRHVFQPHLPKNGFPPKVHVNGVGEEGQ
jgi:hypothetical protein